MVENTLMMIIMVSGIVLVAVGLIGVNMRNEKN